MRATDVPISPEAELAHERRMLERIAGGAPLAGTLEAICRQVECCYPDARCTVLVLDRSLGVLRHGAAPSMPAEFVRQIDGLPAAEGVGACGTAAARAEVVVSAEVAADPGMREFVELAERFELRSVWSQPLVHADGEVIGTFAVYRSRPHTPGREERERVSAAARLATIAIDADTSRRVLREAANLDTLTGLLNRTRFLELVTDALRREPAAPVAAVMVQIDRFAELNRSIGQVAGDRVLVEVAERLRAVCEPHGPLARFAGDTFIAMDAAPPRSGAAERRRSARRLTTLIEQALSEPFHADGVELVLSASIGVATSDLAADALALAREA
ncbi:MAG TPA: sensor domain-containing diguanylate cyclase, partial [Solirubrobacteraceae bacterium]|nr:sensor domain-containing diguanylate cyclase [Solirubrobacteraceae bacterium]